VTRGRRGRIPLQPIATISPAAPPLSTRSPTPAPIICAATGATYAITPCHNCHAQVHDLSEHYKGGYHTVHLWTLICLSMGILGPNERTYLGEDLAELLMPETREAE
jgi:hypothetical protein